MPNMKPLFPMPWWSMNDACAPRCDEALPQEEFIVRFVGVDCDGNALYCVRRRRLPCEPTRPQIQPRCSCAYR